METKDILALMLLAMALMGWVGLTCISQRAREVAFFLMTALAVVSDRFDVNFLSRYWYRGSTRGIEISLIDVIALSLFISSFLFPKKGFSRWRWPAGLGFMLLFFFYAFGSTLVIEPRLFGMFEISKMVRGLIFFLAAAMFVRSEREVGILVFALCCAVCLEGALALKQRVFDYMGRSAGTLDHANSLSMYVCLVAPIFVGAINSALPRLLRWFSAIALAAASFTIVATVSRAGIPIFLLVVLATTVFCIQWRLTFQKIATIAVVAVGVCVVGVKFSDDLKERYFGSSLAEEYLDEKTIDSRGYYLRLARLMIEERFFGVGLNNWSYAVSKTYGKELNTSYSDYDDIPADFNEEEDLPMSFAAPAHNLCALTVGELGVPGLVLFLLMWLRWLQIGVTFLWRRQRTTVHLVGIGLFFGMVGVFLQSLTEWIYRQTAIYLTFHVLIGALVSLYAIRKATNREVVPEPAFVEAEYELVETRAD
ncbi:MAG TPA: O-antigen ligase family protein [Verrucomicrobiae bacterium]|nr:O-antigen ligase family protein [Verrucomicrobiae bacterium]